MCSLSISEIKEMAYLCRCCSPALSDELTQLAQTLSISDLHFISENNTRGCWIVYVWGEGERGQRREEDSVDRVNKKSKLFPVGDQ